MQSPFLWLFYFPVAYQMGDACDVGEQCVDPNSSCIDGACQCKVNYIASLDGINCIPSKSKSNMNKKPVGLQWQKMYFSTWCWRGLRPGPAVPRQVCRENLHVDFLQNFRVLKHAFDLIFQLFYYYSDWFTTNQVFATHQVIS